MFTTYYSKVKGTGIFFPLCCEKNSLPHSLPPKKTKTTKNNPIKQMLVLVIITMISFHEKKILELEI